MSSIAIVVLEGKDSIIDQSKRQERAIEIAKQKGAKGSPQFNRAYYEALYRPEHLALDSLVEGNEKALRYLETEYDALLLVTPRPHTLQQATEAWFEEHHIWINSKQLRFKHFSSSQDSEQYLTNTAWKVKVVMELAGAHEEILYIDTTGEARRAVAEKLPNVRTASGLKEAVTYLKQERTIENLNQVLTQPDGFQYLRSRSFPLTKLFTEAGTSYGEPEVNCPVCGYSYVSVKSFEQVGSTDILHFIGECSHVFALVLEFHKGVTLAYLVREPNEDITAELYEPSS